MPDVYVEAGKAKFMKPKGMDAYVAPAQAGLERAVTSAVKKTNSGMTTVKPGDGKGIQVNVMLRNLAQDGTSVTCDLISDLIELPTKQRFVISGTSTNGAASVPGKLAAVAEDCVAKAVTDLMGKIGQGIAGSQTAQASGPTATGKSPLIFIVVEASYTSDKDAAPQDLAARTKAAALTAMERRFKKNSRFTLNKADFKPGMPAYLIKAGVEKLWFDAKAGEMVALAAAVVAEYPSNNIRAPRSSARSKVPGLTKPLNESEQIGLMADAAEGTLDKAIQWMLDTHP
jgi:hypothetical protein